ncbi:MAG: AmmeMemoRadiSam system protein A [Acidobacteria bacterium]|nr:AmmeMemoRadiSam system protein A [Acidobacteriota bacterium]
MPPLTEEERRILLGLAREALELGVRGKALNEEVPALPAALLAPQGAFVTLRKQERLRGCIGHVRGDQPLYQTVRECAVAAALSDPRFPSVLPEEIPLIHIEISVLSELQVVAPEQVEVGKHGLFISQGRRRGLLLPQVPLEWHWDREKFLEETCMKAGLPADAWRHGATIEAFAAQVFGEQLDAATSEPESKIPFHTIRSK